MSTFMHTQVSAGILLSMTHHITRTHKMNNYIHGTNPYLPLKVPSISRYFSETTDFEGMVIKYWYLLLSKMDTLYMYG